MPSMLNDLSGGRLKNSPLLPIFYFVGIVLMVCIGRIFVEDYMTSRYGYEMWPTAKTAANVAMFVALIPQMGGVFFMVVGLNRGNLSALLISVTCMVVDIVSDLYYKSQYPPGTGFTWRSFWFALPETILVYTVMSEFIAAIVLNELIALWPAFLERMGTLGAESMAAIRAVLKKIQFDDALMGSHNGGQQQMSRPQPGPSPRRDGQRRESSLFEQEE